VDHHETKPSHLQTKEAKRKQRTARRHHLLLHLGIDFPPLHLSLEHGFLQGRIDQASSSQLVHFVPTQNTSGIDAFTYSITNGDYTLTGTAAILVGTAGFAKPPPAN
jgi:hypothetical protein